MTVPLALAMLALLADRVWKHLAIVRFFRRPVPIGRPVALVSILQPILSGDPTLVACLEATLRSRTRQRREFLWLVDSDDVVGQLLCRDLIARYPEEAVTLVTLPPPEPRQNPKLVKLIAGARLARGDVLCVLDDDTQLPDDGLDECLPYLDQPGVGLAFGLPYYVNFATLWSGLVAAFVNSQSLLTYVPYTMLSEPLTINGMFYLLRRSIFTAVGGFEGLEATLADDFAVAQRLRAHGYRLAQTPLRHGISTHVAGPRAYLRLMQRWLVFPRESLLRHLGPRHLALLYGVVLAPAFLPWLVLAGLAARPSRWTAGAALLYFAASGAQVAHLNRAYLRGATPRRWLWLTPILQLGFPLQVLVALLAPQRIVWRGHVIRVERGGAFQMIRRPPSAP